MGDLAVSFDAWAGPFLYWLGQFLTLAGALVAVIGAVGVLRFPDVYTRMHASSVTDTLAVLLMILGMMLLAGWTLVSLKLAMIFVFLMITSPTAAHALAHAALSDNVDPLVGDWTPGRREAAE